MIARIGCLGISSALLVAVHIASADTAFTGWQATAVVESSAYDFEQDIALVTCDKSATYTAVISDRLSCSAQTGYGYGDASVSFSAAVDAKNVETSLRGAASGYWYWHPGYESAGGGSARYEQVHSFHVVGESALQLDGSLHSSIGCAAAVRILEGPISIAEIVDINDDGDPTVFDEELVLGEGDYTIVLALDVTSHSEPPSSYGSGRVGATLSASLSSTVGVERSDWGRIKAMYR